MTCATVLEVKSRFDVYLKASEKGPIFLTRNGKPVAMLLGGRDDEEIERLMMAYSPKLRRILDRAKAQVEGGRGIPADRFWAELEAGYKRPKRPARQRKSAVR